MTTNEALEFNLAIQTASYGETGASTVRAFNREGALLPFASFLQVAKDSIEIKLVPTSKGDHRHKQIVGLINYFADLFDVTLFVDIDPRHEAGKAAISLFETSGFMKGIPFANGSIPLCRYPRSLM
jgi:hypothetical protein